MGLISNIAVDICTLAVVPPVACTLAHRPRRDDGDAARLVGRGAAWREIVPFLLGAAVLSRPWWGPIMIEATAVI